MIEKILQINCANCPLNDGMVYTSLPPKFRCTATGEYNLGEHMCGKVKIFYDENMKSIGDLTKTTELNLEELVDNIRLTLNGTLNGFDENNPYTKSIFGYKDFTNLSRDIDIE